MTSLLTTDNYNIKNWSEKFTKFNVKIFSLPLSIVWKKNIFNDVCVSTDCNIIDDKLSQILKENNGNIDIFPYPDLLFSAFNHTKYNDTKVIFIGLDPYFNSHIIHNKQIPEAMGLSFSVPVGIKIPSSLRNIYNNALEYGHFYKYPDHGNLEFWAYQGCLLLNTALTVKKGCVNSHISIWKSFTDNIISNLSTKFEKLVFVLWGASALTKLNLIDTKKHAVLISSHPSGLSNNKPLNKYPSFSSIDQFGTINNMLKKFGKTEIIWQI